MDAPTAEEMTVGLELAAPRPKARRDLVGAVQDLLPPAVAEPVRVWAAGGDTTGPESAPAQDLAVRLARQAERSPALARELRHWLIGLTSTHADSGARVANSVAGAAHIAGAVVQARDISGGVHLYGTGAPTAGAPPAVPRQLLPAPGHFINRRHECAELDRLMSSADGGPVIAVISGPAGIGKTALARSWLLGRAGAFPDGQLYADLRGHSPGGPARPGELLTELLRSLGHERVPAALGEQAALWRTVTVDRRIALLLDNARSSAQVRPLLPGSTHALTVVTSRYRMTALGLEGASFLPLTALGTGDTMELLSRKVGADRVSREPEAALAMAEACAGLPLAACVVGARLAARPHEPLAAMARALGGDADASPLDALRVEGQPALRAALQESYRLLAPGPAACYRRLGLLPEPRFTPWAAAAVCGVEPAIAGRLLDDLVEANLLEDLGPDPRTGLTHHRFHDLLRVHAHERALAEETAADRDDAVRRVVDHYLYSATAAEALLTPSHRTLRRDYAGPPVPPPFSTASAALSWLDAERVPLMAVLRTAAERGWHDAAWQLADALWPLLLRLRPYDLWVEAHEIGLAAARAAGDRDGVARMLTSGGAGLRNAGRHDEAAAWFRQALDAAREDVAALAPHEGEDPPELRTARRAEAQALHGLGQTLRLAGRLDEAQEYFVRALDLRERIGYRRGAALTRLCLGDVALAAGRPDEALPHLVRARAELLAEHDPYDAARALAHLGRARAAGGDDTAHRTSHAELLQALAEFEETGSRHWQGRVLEMLGEGAEEGGDVGRAREWYEQSLARYRTVSETDARRLVERLARLL